ncbi:galactose mutarotase-like domain-containing protein [Pseudomassariella vexata]|uniref:Galactose mutarotase-like domain-containing protein n=1 Tax=Pseudomassariella vexata TaxID=1141098 RepID=A0A1Y2E9I7_9PEZI|nr:galactose mutarotase-like domain-containing protein [Pseudomassariella vexata]ORY68248.1 galactose mutarotase-like domain-containing protein [Pseudomassariella vexata]
MSSEIQLLPLGAIIQAFKVDGFNIVQGFPTQDLYVTHNGPYFGETIGRVANRISNAKITSLNGKSYSLAANNGPNNLHGGVVGWGKRVWKGPKPVGLREIPGVKLDEGGESVEFTLTSEDGDEGFPGEVAVKVTYTSGKQTLDGKSVTVLGWEYEAELVGGAEETVINMTNHSYFNLSGGPTIEGTKVQLCTPSYLPVDGDGIPTGGPKDFTKVAVNSYFTLGAVAPDIDDCFVVDAKSSPSQVPLDTRSCSLTKLVSASHAESKVHLEVLSTEPAFQFYTGKYIDVKAAEGAPARGPRSGFCVEPSRYVNACNVDEWKAQMLLKKGDKYGSRTVYRAWKE